MNVELRVYLETLVKEMDRRVEQRFELLRQETARTEVHLRERLKLLQADMTEREGEIRDLQRSKSYLDGRLMTWSGIAGAAAAVVVTLAIQWLSS